MRAEDFERIEGKLDRIESRLGSIDVTLARQTEQLGEHMRRTEIAEENLSTVRLELAPLKEARAQFVWGVKFAKIAIAVLAGGVSAAGTVLHILGRI